jgi:hypothetical protein
MLFLIIFGISLLPTLFCLPFKKEDNLLSWACNGVDLSYANSTYCLYVNNTLGFTEAENFCNGNGTLVQTKGHLVAIHSSFVNAFFRGTLLQGSQKVYPRNLVRTHDTEIFPKILLVLF